MDGPGFLGGPDQPTWHKPRSEEDKRLSQAQRKAKAAQMAHGHAKAQEEARQQAAKALQQERKARQAAATQARALDKPRATTQHGSDHDTCSEDHVSDGDSAESSRADFDDCYVDGPSMGALVPTPRNE